MHQVYSSSMVWELNFVRRYLNVQLCAFHVQLMRLVHLAHPPLFDVYHQCKQRLHDPSLVEHILFHTETSMQHNGSLRAVFSIAFAEPCTLLLNGLCIIIVYDLTGRKERIVNESIHHWAQVCLVDTSQQLFREGLILR